MIKLAQPTRRFPTLNLTEDCLTPRALQSFGAKESHSEGVDGESSNGGALETNQPERHSRESQAACSGQEARCQPWNTARLQKVWKDKMSLLYLLQKYKHTHKHLDWSDLAHQAQHHLRGLQCCVQHHLLPQGRPMPEKTSPICGQSGLHPPLQN